MTFSSSINHSVRSLSDIRVDISTKKVRNLVKSVNLLNFNTFLCKNARSRMLPILKFLPDGSILKTFLKLPVFVTLKSNLESKLFSALTKLENNLDFSFSP